MGWQLLIPASKLSRFMAFFVLGSLSWTGAVALAQSTRTQAQGLADQYINVFQEKEQRKAEIEFLRNGTEQLKSGNGDQPPGVSELDEDTQAAVEDFLKENISPLTESLVELDLQRREDVKEIESEWRTWLTHRNEAKINAASIEAKRRVRDHFASLVSLDNKLFWLSASMAVVILFFFAWHDRRHEYRRALNGLEARGYNAYRRLKVLMITLTAISIIVLVCGGFTFKLLTGTLAPSSQAMKTIEDEIEKVEDEKDRLQKTYDELKAKADAGIHDWATSAYLGDQWRDMRSKLLPVVVQRHLESSMARELDANLDEYEKLKASLPGMIAANRRYDRYKNIIQSAIGTLLMMVVGVGIAVFRRDVRQRKKKAADTCPLCLGHETLKSGNDAMGDDDSELENLTCTNVIDRNTEEECGFTFLSVYQDMTKLCFPTVGHPRAGKTHWLAMVYRQLNQADYDGEVLFQKVKSSEAEDFDRLVDEIINARLDPSATQSASVPRPLLFNFTDQDRWGISSALLNIFDYSGEVTQRMSLEESQRRRMLEADGYFFFLDPTETAEDQAKELVNFAEDVRIVRELKSGQAMHAPVALCVPKIDLLTNMDYADPEGRGPVDRFYDDLANFDEGKRISRKAIQARSDIMKELRHTIWPGWQIEKQIQQLFGGRYMYFPFTPVGLSELGETDLSKRTIAPRYILEPFMWLLDMNGYRVLDDN